MRFLTCLVRVCVQADVVRGAMDLLGTVNVQDLPVALRFVLQAASKENVAEVGGHSVAWGRPAGGRSCAASFFWAFRSTQHVRSPALYRSANFCPCGLPSSLFFSHVLPCLSVRERRCDRVVRAPSAQVVASVRRHLGSLGSVAGRSSKEAAGSEAPVVLVLGESPARRERARNRSKTRGGGCLNAHKSML